jgi:hypothetical protein
MTGLPTCCLRVVLLVALAAALSACAAGPTTGPASHGVADAGATGAAGSAATDPAADLGPAPGNVPTDVIDREDRPTVRVMMVTLPVGTVSGNEKVWRLLNEDALDADTSVLLAQNGLRAAVAPLARWPSVAALIDGPAATSRWLYCQTDGRTPLLIRTHESIQSQTLFIVDKDTHLEGRTYNDCDNGLRLSMSKQRGTGDILVQLEPVVQMGTVSYGRLVQGLSPSSVTEPREDTLVGLRIAAQLKPGTFLLVAPADPKQPYLVGTRFLANTDKVPATETLLVFIPGAGDTVEPGQH